MFCLHCFLFCPKRVRLVRKIPEVFLGRSLCSPEVPQPCGVLGFWVPCFSEIMTEQQPPSRIQFRDANLLGPGVAEFLQFPRKASFEGRGSSRSIFEIGLKPSSGDHVQAKNPFLTTVLISKKGQFRPTPSYIHTQLLINHPRRKEKVGVHFIPPECIPNP